MSVGWIEGFNVDRSTNALARKYPVIGIGAGLNIVDGPTPGSRAWGGQTSLTYFVTPVLFGGALPSTISVGLKVRSVDPVAVAIAVLLRGAQEQASLWLVPATSVTDGWALEVRRGADVCTRTADQEPGDWRFVELVATCEVEGAWTVRIAGEIVASGRAQLGGYYTPGVDRVAFSALRSSGGACDLTHIYVAADDGIGEPGPLGDGDAVAVRAATQGGADDWTSNVSGDGVDAWKQDGVDLDTSSVRSDTDGDRELAILEPISDVADGVAAVMFGAYGKLASSGVRGARVLVARDGVERKGDGLLTFSSTSDYTYSFAIEETDPVDGSPWTARGLARDEVGFVTTEP